MTIRQGSLITSVLGVVGLGFLLWALLAGNKSTRAHTKSEHRSPSNDRMRSRSTYLQVAGVKPQPFDPASKGIRQDGDAWGMGKELEPYRQIGEEPQDLDVLARQDPQWMPTQTWKMSHGGASDYGKNKEYCAMEHLVQLAQPCKNNISIVIERTDLEEGKVVYAKPLYTSEMDTECQAYAECVAKTAWLGRIAPLPSNSKDLFAFLVGDIRLPGEAETKKQWRAGMMQEIAEIKTNLQALQRFDSDDPNIQQNIQLNQDLLAQLEWLLSL